MVMMRDSTTVLVIGYGNPGRLDDALGPLLAEALEQKELEGVTVDANYQLSVEDAAEIAAHDVVVFMDADTAGPEPFSFRRVEPRKDLSFSSHSISPEALMDMACDLLGARTRGYLLGVRGYEFNEFGEGLSAQAASNYDRALSFLETALVEQKFEEYVGQFAKQAAVGNACTAVR